MPELRLVRNKGVYWRIICATVVLLFTFIIGMVCERTEILRAVEEKVKTILRPLYVGKWPEGFDEADIVSTADHSIQKAMVFRAKNRNLQPLLVSLHTWSGNYKTPDPLASLVKQQNWNYVHPDFRGANNRPEACLGANVVSDIDDAIRYGVSELGADPDCIMVIGMSGGGHAALGHLAISDGPKVKVYSAWCPITDVESWYHQLNARNENSETVRLCCCDTNCRFSGQEAKNRSPLYLPLNKKRLQESSVLIRAGALDGVIGKVPFSHSIEFYNRCCRTMGLASDVVSDAEQIKIYAASNTEHREHETVFEKSAQNINLTLFFGHHEFLAVVAFEELKRTIGNKPTTEWN